MFIVLHYHKSIVQCVTLMTANRIDMKRCEVTGEDTYVPTEREQAFLDTIENPKYDRDIINGLKPFFEDKAPADIAAFYSADELSALASLRGTERDVESRMPVKLTRHFFEMAQNSEPLKRIVKANPDETLNLAGSEDPGYQMDFAPVEGMLHKYEMGLLYTVSTCSAHCRFCYREELISQKDIERQDGTVAKKGLAKIKPVTDYIRAHNRDRCRQRRPAPGNGARETAGSAAVRRRPDGAAQPEDRPVDGGVGRGRSRVDPPRHQGNVLPSQSASTTLSWPCWTISTPPGRTSASG